jgi:hypothetical protein
MSSLFRFPDAVKRHPAVEAWLAAATDELGAIARRWFEVMRQCGPDVRELVHDGNPTACVGEAAFAYVGVFKDHVSLGFFRGTQLPDPESLLEGSGRFMLHVKLRPGDDVAPGAVSKLIAAAYADMKSRVRQEGK